MRVKMNKSLIVVIIFAFSVYSSQPMPLRDYSNGSLTYSTNWHNLEVQIAYPNSWTIVESTSPRVIHSFRTPDEDNLILYDLSFTEILSEELLATLSPEEKENILSRDGSNILIDGMYSKAEAEVDVYLRGLQNVHNISKEKIVIDGCPSFLVEAEGTFVQYELDLYVIQYFVAYKNAVVKLNCRVYKYNRYTPEIFEQIIMESRQFFDIIANSITIREQ